MHVVLLSRDLMLISGIDGAAARHGATAISVGSAESAVQACIDHTAPLLVVDLRTPGVDIAAVVAGVRERSPEPVRIMACGPHVHEASLAAAVAAGCDEVVTRGEFDRRIDAALARLAAS